MNALESLGVAIITIVGVGVFDKVGVEINFAKRRHLVAFGVACLWCFVSAMLGAEMTSALLSNSSFEKAYVKWLGRNLAGISYVLHHTTYICFFGYLLMG